MNFDPFTLVTADEEFDPVSRMTERIKEYLESIEMDVYNETYVVQVTVAKVDRTARRPPSDDPDDIPF